MKNEIIGILQQNARMSAAAIGEILGISAAAAEAEIAKLEKEILCGNLTVSQGIAEIFESN